MGAKNYFDILLSTRVAQTRWSNISPGPGLALGQWKLLHFLTAKYASCHFFLVIFIKNLNLDYVDTLQIYTFAYKDSDHFCKCNIFLILKREILGLKYSFELVWLKFQNNLMLKYWLIPRHLWVNHVCQNRIYFTSFFKLFT